MILKVIQGHIKSRGSTDNYGSISQRFRDISICLLSDPP